MGDFLPPCSAPSDQGADVCREGEVVLNIWGQWAVHTLVLLSLLLQFTLFVLAGFRRRNANAVLRSILWLTYQLADSVATYTLGHLFVTTSCGKQPLIAFWAPFLLLHLGGQDTITAYALEDSRLWRRHLQALLVQVVAAIFVLVGYFQAGGWALVTAVVFIFLVGSLKYVERIWALRCAGTNGMYSFLIRYCKQTPATQIQLQPEEHESAGRNIFWGLQTEEERFMNGAHTLLGISLCMFLDSEGEACRHNKGALSVLAYLVSANDRDIYRVIEMQLSLIYDLMYTKARVIHTRYGLCIRVFSLLAIIATMMFMFRFVPEADRVDSAITYVLLVGAFVMEIASGFMAIVSTWTRHQLYMNHGWMWNLVVCLRRFVNAKWWRRWSGLIGQFNMIEDGAEASSRYLDGISRLQLFQGKIYVLPPPLQVSEYLQDAIREEIARVVGKCYGAADRMYTLNRNTELLHDNSDFDRKVIIWHIATHLILDSISAGEQEVLREKMDQTKALSDYMMFLLYEHPEMLPGHTRRNLCTEAIKYLQDLGRGQESDISKLLLAKGRSARAQGGQHGRDENSTCMNGAALALELRLDKRWNTARVLKEVFEVWVEMLCYAGSHCSRDSHARSLSIGGEFLTVVWLLAGHFADYERFKRASANTPNTSN